MNRKFKKLLGAVVATVAAVGTMMAVNAVSAFAATATWDWKNNNPTNITSFSFSEDNATETLASNNAQISLTVMKNPSDTNATWDNYFKANGDNVAFKNGAIIRVPVKNIGDKVTVVPYRGYTDGTQAPTDGVTVYTATDADKEKQYIELSGTTATYLHSITYEENTAVTESIYTWDFTTTPLTAIAMPYMAAEKYPANRGDVSLTVSGEKFEYNNSNSFEIYNSKIKVPVYNEGDTITVTPYSGYGSNIKIGTQTGTSGAIIHNATSDEKTQGYVLVEADGQGYITGITLTLATDKLAGSTSSNKAAILAKGTEYYVVALVPAASVEASTTLTVTATGKTPFAVDTVYKKVSIGGKEYTAADLGGAEDDYVHGFVVTSASKPASLTEVQNKVTVELS